MKETGFDQPWGDEPPPALDLPKPDTIAVTEFPLSQTATGRRKPVAIRRSPLRTALYMIGVLMIMFSTTMLPPMGVAWWYDGDAVVLPFAEAMGVMLGLGLLCWSPVCRYKVDLRNRDGFMVVVAFWFLLSLIGALPFMLSDKPHMPLVDAVFETVSGLTTTGATVLSGLDAMPRPSSITGRN